MVVTATQYRRSAYWLCSGLAVFAFGALAVHAQLGSQSTANIGPEIVRSVPQSGGHGQYVTIMGSRLGTTPGSVTFVKGGQAVDADTQFIAQCQRVWWRDSSIIVKVPVAASNGLNKIKIKAADGTPIKELDFTVTNGVAPPGICAITPDNGPTGVSVHLYGERFGEVQGRVTFGNLDGSIVQNGWHDSEIIVSSVPAFSESQSTIRVIRSDNTLTNPAIFTQGACKANQCGQGNSCCTDGSCRPTGSCEQTATQCTYSWSFSTGLLKALGAVCKNSTECFSASCTGGKCTQGTTAIGQACTFDQQCTVGGLCVNGICSPTLKKIGDQCKDQTECQSNRCVQGICAPGTKLLGDACATGDECSTLKCVAGQCAQQARCLSIEKIEPQGKAIHQNSVFSVTFNQIVDQDSVKKSFNLSPAVQGSYEFQTLGVGNAAKTLARFSPSSLLSLQQAYAVVVGKDVKSAYSDNTLGKCVDSGVPVCTVAGEICTAPNAICTNGARCSGPGATCSGAGTQCVGANSHCVDGADCSPHPHQGCALADASGATRNALVASPDRSAAKFSTFIAGTFSTIKHTVAYGVDLLWRRVFSGVFAADITTVKPIIVHATKNGTAIDLSWTFSGATPDGFEIYRIKDSSTWSDPPALIGTTDGATLSYTDSGPNGAALPAGSYRYKIRAYAGTGGGSTGGGGGGTSGGDDMGETCSVGTTCNSGVCDAGKCTENTVPTAPTGLHVTNTYSNEIDLAWNNDAKNVKDFYIERSTNGSTFTRIPSVTVDKGTFVYADTGLHAFTRYWYRVRASNEIGPAPFSNVVDATTKDQNFCTDTVPVSSPTDVTTTSQTADAVTVSWKRAGTNEHAFELQRADGSSVSFAKVTGIPATDQSTYSYRDFNLTPNTKYTYRIIASNCKAESNASTSGESTTKNLVPNGGSCSDPSQCKSGDCASGTCVASGNGSGGSSSGSSTQKPTAPSNLIAQAKASSEISIDWHLTSTNEKDVLVYRSENGTDFTNIATLGPGTQSYFDRNLSWVKKYYYKVAATNDAGVSDFSNIADATTQIVTWCLFVQKPATPTLNEATARSSSTISLRWNDNSNNETAFFIQRATSSGTYVGAAALVDGSKAYTDVNLTPSTPYSYRILAHNCAGDSDPSNVISATTTAQESGQNSGTAARCGDGIIQTDRGEQCDNGTNAATATCTSTCTFPACGTDGSCPANMKCDFKENTCHPVCTTDTSCQSPLICDMVDHLCRVPVDPICQAASQCTLHDDCKLCVPACSANQRCNPPTPPPDCKAQNLLTCQKTDGTEYCAQNCGSAPVVCSANVGCSLDDDCKLCSQCANAARCTVPPKNCKAQGKYECQDSTGKTFCSDSQNCIGGDVPPGGSCSLNTQCSSLNCQNGTCQPPGTLPPGAQCTNPTQCQSGTCIDGLCGGTTPPGGTCKLDNQCESRSCVNGTCSKLPDGSECTNASQCSSGRCTDDRCGTGWVKPPGSSCTENAQCSSLNCQNGVCQPPGTLPPGAQCTNPTQCQSGTCIDGLCGGTTPPGGTCKLDNQCESHSCVNGSCGKLPDGSECTNAAECSSGRCTDARCGTGWVKPPGSSCTENAQCSSLNCQNGVCQPPGTLPPGSQCTNPTQCQSGTCIDGLCGGTTPPGGTCKLDNQCESRACVNGTCSKLPDGSECTNASQCSSNSCVDARCGIAGSSKLLPTGSACTTNSQCKEGLCFNSKCDADKDHDGQPDSVDPNPNNPDTDGDGLLDGVEDKNHNGKVDPGETDPTNPDTDGDGLLDGREDSNHNGIIDIGETDPLNPNTDGDCLNDGVDPYPLDPTRPDCSKIKKDVNQCPSIKKAEVPHESLFAREHSDFLSAIADVISTIIPHVFASETPKAYSQYSDSSDAIIIGGGGGGTTTTLNAPSDLTIAPIAGRTNPGLHITWTDTNAGLTGVSYTIQRKPLVDPDTNSYGQSVAGSSPVDDPSTDSVGLTAGTTYKYKVCAVKTGANSNCAEQTGSTGTVPTVTSPITRLTISRSSDLTKGISSDVFFCVRNDCTDDANPNIPANPHPRSGNQHRYKATLKDLGGAVTTAGITWSWRIEPSDPAPTYIQGPLPVPDPADTSEHPGMLADTVEVTGVRSDSGASLVVTATQRVDRKILATLEQRIPLTVTACDYTWPESMKTTYSPYGQDQLDFSMWYCRGSGDEGTTLPMLGSVIPLARRVENRNFDYEFIIPIDSSKPSTESANKNIGSDVIVMRIARVRSGTYSVVKWYRDTFHSTPSSHDPVNGYPAVQDANGVYVLAYDTSVVGTLSNVLRGITNEKDTYGPTVYYFTTNTNAQPATHEILAQLLRNIVFSKRIGYDSSDVNTPGLQVRRDVQRMIDMEKLILAMNGAPLLPRIDAGSFIKNQTISAWGTSWNDLGGALNTSLPDDPSLGLSGVDHFSGVTQCKQADGYETSTCWNATSRHFGSTTATGFNDDVETAVKTHGVNAYSYKFFPAANPNDPNAIVRAEFCANTEYLKVSPDAGKLHVLCPVHQRNQDNSQLKSAGVSCAGDNECQSAVCLSNNHCGNGLPNATIRLAPRITAVQYTGVTPAVNLAGYVFKRNWDDSQNKTITVAADEPDTDGRLTSLVSSIGPFSKTDTSYDLDINQLWIGDNVLTVVAEDDYGTRTEKQIHFTVNEKTTNRDPDITINTPTPTSPTTYDSGSKTIIREQANVDLNLNFSASDPDTNDTADSSVTNRDRVTKIHYTLGSLSGDITDPGSSSSASISLDTLADGTYTLTAKAFDKRGGSKEVNLSNIIIRTNTPPTISNAQPADNAVFNHGTAVVISGTATDQDGIAWVALYRLDASGAGTRVADTSTAPYTFTLSNLDVGSYAYMIRASDSRSMEGGDVIVHIKVIQNGDWSAWSACSQVCGVGTKSRSCDNPAPSSNGGAQCLKSDNTTRALTETVSCNNGPCPDWSPSWSVCSQECGVGGTQTKTCVDPDPTDAAGGTCTNASGVDVSIGGTQSQSCTNGTCPAWSSAWSACSKPCGPTGIQTKTCTPTSSAGGRCASPDGAIGDTQTQSCNRSISCVSAHWSTYTPASCPSCGPSDVILNRSCVLGNDGTTCTGSPTYDCHTPVCVSASWSAWSPASCPICAASDVIQSRSCTLGNDGTTCSGSSTNDCGTPVCPSADFSYSYTPDLNNAYSAQISYSAKPGNVINSVELYKCNNNTFSICTYYTQIYAGSGTFSNLQQGYYKIVTLNSTGSSYYAQLWLGNITTYGRVEQCADKVTDPDCTFDDAHLCSGGFTGYCNIIYRTAYRSWGCPWNNAVDYMKVNCTQNTKVY